MAKVVVTKEALIGDFLKTKTGDTAKNKALSKKMKKYLSKNPTPQLAAVLQILNIFAYDNNNSDIQKCYEMAVPIFEYLDTVTEFEHIDLEIFARVIHYLADFNKTHELFIKALTLLDEKCAIDPSYNGTRTALYFNLTNRILRAKFYEKDVDADFWKIHSKWLMNLH